MHSVWVKVCYLHSPRCICDVKICLFEGILCSLPGTRRLKHLPVLFACLLNLQHSTGSKRRPVGNFFWSAANEHWSDRSSFSESPNQWVGSLVREHHGRDVQLPYISNSTNPAYLLSLLRIVKEIFVADSKAIHSRILCFFFGDGKTGPHRVNVGIEPTI